MLVDAGGVNVVADWYAAQPDKVQAKFDTRLRYLRQQPRDKWVRPYFDTLSGGCAGLGEIRFEYKNVQHRPIGFSSGEMEYTVLFFAIEKDNKFEPRTTCRQSQNRKIEVQRDESRKNVLEVE